MIQILSWLVGTLLCALTVGSFTALLDRARQDRGRILGLICLGMLIPVTAVRTYGEFTNFDQYVREMPSSVYGIIMFMSTVGLTIIFLPAGLALYCGVADLKARLNKRAVYTTGTGLLLAWVSLFTNMLNFGYPTGPSASFTLTTISALSGLATLIVMGEFQVEMGIKRAKVAKAVSA